MNKKEANPLIPIVSNTATLDAILGYTDYRIGILKDSFLNASTMDEVKKIQGAIEELKRFKTLRDEVNNAKD